MTTLSHGNEPIQTPMIGECWPHPENLSKAADRGWLSGAGNTLMMQDAAERVFAERILLLDSLIDENWTLFDRNNEKCRWKAMESRVSGWQRRAAI